MKFNKKRNLIIAVLAVLVVLSLGLWLSVNYLAHRLYPLEYLGEITDNSTRYSLEPAQVAAIIYEESKFDPDVVSSQDAIGLMQVLPDTANVLAKDLGINNLWRDDLFVPSINIKFGTYYYRGLLDRYGGRVDLALAAYNAGFGAVDKSGKDISKLPQETQEFVRRVERTERVYTTLYPDELGVNKKKVLSFWQLAIEVERKIWNQKK